MLRVSYMNEKLKECAFQHIIKKIISYLISSQLDDLWHENWRFLENHSKSNYLCAHLQVWFGKTNGIIWWLTFEVPLADFSSTRRMEFHGSGHWKFKTQCPPSFWVWIGLNRIFGLWETSSVNFKGKKLKKLLSKNFFHYLKTDAFRRIAQIQK